MFGKKLVTLRKKRVKKNFLTITCQHATLLMSKHEEGKLTWLQRLQLRMHVGICSWCKLFELQTRIITKQAKHTHEQVTLQMPTNTKQQLMETMQQLQKQP